MGFLETIFGLRKTEKIKPVYTGTEVTYAESTWTSEQFFRDVLQNHFDAEANKFCAQLEGTYIDNFKELRELAKSDDEFKGKYKKVIFYLFLLTYRAGDLHDEDKKHLMKRIKKISSSIGVEMSNKFAPDNFIENIRPDRPVLTYAVRNMDTRKIIRGINIERLTTEFEDTDKYPLFECDIADSGKGYDSKKSVLYLPTKEDAEWCKGLFGEGLKVNQAKAMRTPGVQIRMSSVYERPNKEKKVWARRPGIDDGEIIQSGFDAVISNDSELDFKDGSRTTIRFQKLTPESLELSRYMDPRITDLSKTSLELLEDTIMTYPRSFGSKGKMVMPGITDPGSIYMKGLKVKDDLNGKKRAYNYWDNGILDGRDRSRLNETAIEAVKEDFWVFMNSPELIQQLVDDVFGEEEVPYDECRMLGTALKKTTGKIREIYLDCLKKTLERRGLSDKKRNVIAVTSDLDRVKNGKENYNFISINTDGEWEDIKDLVEVIDDIYSGTQNRFFKYQDIEHRLSNDEEYVGELSERKKEFRNYVEMKVKGVIKQLTGSYPFSSLFQYYMFANNIMEDSVKTKILAGEDDVSKDQEAYRESTAISLEFKDGRIVIKILFPSDDAFLKEIDDIESKILITILALIMSILKGRDLEFGENIEHNLANLANARYFIQRGVSELADLNFSQLKARPNFDWRVFSSLTKLMQEQSLGAMVEDKKGKEKSRIQSLLDEVDSFAITPERLLEIANQTNIGSLDVNSPPRMLSEFLKRVYGRCLTKRICISGYLYYIENRKKNSQVLKKVKVSDLPKVGVFNGNPVRVLNKNQLVIEYDTKVPSVLKSAGLNDEQYIVDQIDFRYQDIRFQLDDDYIFSGGEAFNSYIDQGCILLHWEERSGTKEDLTHYINSFEYLTTNPVRDEKDLFFKKGIVESPVTLKYISKSWSEPKRIFQDLHQNHRDASPNGVKERFLISKDGENIWVEEEELGKSEILGYELSDDGSGYSPHGIQNMGHTRKRNPLLTGQNGEGLKMASAACLKHGLEIEFSSTGLNEQGQLSSWVAKAFTKDEEYDEGDEVKHVDRLCYKVEEQDLKNLQGQSSRTRIKISEDASLESLQTWKKWRVSIDPRKKNKFGDKGINGLILKDLKTQPGAVTVGPVTCLPNRQGFIYEHGELMRSTPQDGMKFMLGWNFPRISNTRERKYFNNKLVRHYIDLFIQNCTDENLIEVIIKLWDELIFKEYEKDFKESEMPEVISDYFLGAINDGKSAQIFRKVFKKLFPDKILFSREYARRAGIDLSGNFDHTAEKDRIYLSFKIYSKLRFVLPSMDMWANVKRDVIIECGDLEKDPLREEVKIQIEEVKTILTNVKRQNPEYLADLLRRTKITFEKVLKNLEELKDGVKSGSVGDVFYGADNSVWHGLASVGIGINMELTMPGMSKRRGAVIDHEIVHKMTGLKDYENEFIEFLTLLASARKLR